MIIAVTLAMLAFDPNEALTLATRNCKAEPECVKMEYDAQMQLYAKGKPDAAKLKGCMFGYVITNGPHDTSKLFRFLNGCLK